MLQEESTPRRGKRAAGATASKRLSSLAKEAEAILKVGVNYFT